MSPGCPACGAGWRGTATCSRCGADLSAVMELALAAFQLRARSRRLLIEGDLEGAAALAGEAERRDATPAGDALVRVTSLLAAIAAA